MHEEHDIPPEPRPTKPDWDMLEKNQPFHYRADAPEWIRDFFGFQEMLTPTLVRILFVVGLPFVVFAAFGYCFEGYNPDGFSGTNGTGRFLGAMILSAVGLLAWRIACEMAIVLFSIYEEAKKP